MMQDSCRQRRCINVTGTLVQSFRCLSIQLPFDAAFTSCCEWRPFRIQISCQGFGLWSPFVRAGFLWNLCCAR